MKNLETSLQQEGLNASVEIVKVADEGSAAQLKFLGSPSFRIDGHDLWSEERENYSLSCRVYPTSEGIKGFPSVAMLKQQLKQFKGE